MTELDIVIPVYNEGENIIPLLESLRQHVQTPVRVLICYDRDDDTTLPAVDAFRTRLAADNPEPAGVEGSLATAVAAQLDIVRVKNRSRGVHNAIMTGFAHTTAPAVLVMPADDDYNAPILDSMVAAMKRRNADIACASRFIPGGCMSGCPVVKSVLVRLASFTLRHFARLPAHDATNGFRLFSRRIIDTVPIQSDRGFTFSLELLVKAHRLGWKVAEVPAQWHERTKGTSRFKLMKWLPAYLRWYFYAFATTWLWRRRTEVASGG
jgi:glycosyltransferase involved in cell wall biosynthesis